MEDSFFEKHVKPILCHDNWFSNLTYWIYKDIECGCCIFYRGIVTGIVAVTAVEMAVDIIKWMF